MLTPKQVAFNKKIAIVTSTALILVVSMSVHSATQVTLDSTIQRTIAMTTASLFSSPIFTLPATMLVISSVRLATQSKSQKNAYRWAAVMLLVSSLIASAAAVVWREYATGADGLAFLSIYLYTPVSLTLGIVMLLLSRNSKKKYA